MEYRRGWGPDNELYETAQTRGRDYSIGIQFGQDESQRKLWQNGVFGMSGESSVVSCRLSVTLDWRTSVREAPTSSHLATDHRQLTTDN